LSTLTDYVGGYTVAGLRLKEAGTDHWTNQPPSAGDNSSGFKALPGGARNVWGSNSSFNSINNKGNWWTADQLADEDAEYMFLQSGSWWAWGISNGGSGDNHNKKAGYSVRCIKDVTP